MVGVPAETQQQYATCYLQRLQMVDVWNRKAGFEGTRIPLFTDTLPYLGPGREYYVEIKKGDVNMVPELLKIVDNSGIPQEQFTMICPPT